jgi:RNA ligase (TIGR02306 family)
MSTEHDVRVVRIGTITRHDNADTLSITEVDGRPCIIRTGEYAEGDLAVYVPIDSLVPVADPRFAFLADKAKGERARIKAMRLRGVFSMGLLVKPDADMAEGDEVRERMGIEIYEPDASQGGHGPGGRFGSSKAERDPGILPVYDVESARKYRGLLVDGEEVVLTEKVHGANARYVFHEGRLWCASRNQFKQEDPGDLWWCLAFVNDLPAKLARHPGIALYGEAFGQVQDLKYGRDDHALVLFDALDIRTRRFLDYDDFRRLADALDLPTTPELYRGPWSADRWPEFKAMAEGATIIGDGRHTREGWVLRTTRERYDNRLGRVQMKLVGEGYLTRKAA